MKKKITIIAMGLMLAGTLQAQIYIEEGEVNENRAAAQDLGVVPYHGVTHDQANFTPIGCGIAIFTVLSGAYLLGKQNKERKNMK